MWEDWISNKGISKSKMTAAQAKEFIGMVQSSSNPLIKDFLENIARQVAEETAKIAATRSAANGDKKALKKINAEVCKGAKGVVNMTTKKTAGMILKKALGAVARKSPAVILFFAYDWYQGGLGHATNEATWPFSMIWGGE